MIVITTKPVILFVPRNPLGEMPHGGVKRDAQITELLAATGLAVERIERFPHDIGRLTRVLHGPAFAYRMTGRVPTSLSAVRWEAGRYARWRGYERTLREHSGARLIVIENTRDHSLLITAARNTGLRVVCVPHDIEALSAGLCRHDRPLGQLGELWEEMAALGQADAVFAISYEEQWLLRGFGVPADALPPFPAADALAEAKAIRTARADAAKTHLLLFGSAIHPPTGEGMAEAIGWLAGWDARPWPVTVAGFGSEVLAPSLPPDGFRLAGGVTPTELARLLTTAVAVIVHQRFGCGALTRIPELVMAGVPVVANRIAARSFHGMPGVFVYDDAAELRHLLAGPFTFPAEPTRPLAAEQRFVATVAELAAASPTRIANAKGFE